MANIFEAFYQNNPKVPEKAFEGFIAKMDEVAREIQEKYKVIMYYCVFKGDDGGVWKWTKTP